MSGGKNWGVRGKEFWGKIGTKVHVGARMGVGFW
jgi:hypothetical protein